MDFMSFFSGNGLFLILGLVLIIVFLYNKMKNRKR
jgi:flagellar biogenesis protein FliO